MPYYYCFVEVWKLHYFNEEVSESCLMKWEELYKHYRQDMTDALNQNTETKNEAANEVIKKYKAVIQIIFSSPF